MYVVAKTPLTQTVMSFEEFFFFSFTRKSSQSHFTQGFVSVQFLDSCGVFVSPALEIMGMCQGMCADFENGDFENFRCMGFCW